MVSAFFSFTSSLVLYNLKSLLSCLWLRVAGELAVQVTMRIDMPMWGLQGTQGCCHLGPHRQELGQHSAKPCPATVGLRPLVWCPWPWSCSWTT